MSDFEVYYPRSIAEAIDGLLAYATESAILAGGTDLLVNLKSGRARYRYLISLQEIEAFQPAINVEGAFLTISPLVTMSEICRHPMIEKYFKALKEAAYLMGSQQIRNQATVVGNLCNASPAAEVATPLLIYEASVHIQGKEKDRMIPLASFFKGPRKADLEPGEIVTGIKIPLPPVPESSLYRRISRRAGVDLAIVNLSMGTECSGGIKVAYGSLAPTPFRATEVEKAIQKVISGEISEKALGEIINNCISPIDDLRSSKEYKREMIQLLTLEGMEALCKKAGGTKW